MGKSDRWQGIFNQQRGSYVSQVPHAGWWSVLSLWSLSSFERVCINYLSTNVGSIFFSVARDFHKGGSWKEFADSVPGLESGNSAHELPPSSFRFVDKGEGGHPVKIG